MALSKVSEFNIVENNLSRKKVYFDNMTRLCVYNFYFRRNIKNYLPSIAGQVQDKSYKKNNFTVLREIDFAHVAYREKNFQNDLLPLIYEDENNLAMLNYIQNGDKDYNKIFPPIFETLSWLKEQGYLPATIKQDIKDCESAKMIVQRLDRMLENVEVSKRVDSHHSALSYYVYSDYVANTILICRSYNSEHYRMVEKWYQKYAVMTFTALKKRFGCETVAVRDELLKYATGEVFSKDVYFKLNGLLNHVFKAHEYKYVDMLFRVLNNKATDDDTLDKIYWIVNDFACAVREIYKMNKNFIDTSYKNSKTLRQYNEVFNFMCMCDDQELYDLEKFIQSKFIN